MHEMAIALNIVDLAQSQARLAGGGRISRIELEIGSLAGVMTESLEFCFECASQGTLAAGANLEIEKVSGKASCLACGKLITVDRYDVMCNECGGFMEIIAGEDLRLKAITVEERQ